MIRRYAQELGLRLELEHLDGTLAIVAYEIQTGLRLADLPGMEQAGCWRSWTDSLNGLKRISVSNDEDI